MKRNTMLKIINPINGLLIVNQLVTAALHGSMSHETYEIAHKGGGILLAVGIAIHVVLNGNWIKANFLKSSTASTDEN